jgi:hypothetical protein
VDHVRWRNARAAYHIGKKHSQRSSNGRSRSAYGRGTDHPGLCRRKEAGELGGEIIEADTGTFAGRSRRRLC